MKEFQDNLDNYLATACRMLDADGMDDAASVLRRADVKIEETGYDNWNGGTRIWTVYLFVDAVEYAQLGSRRDLLEEQIHTHLEPLVETISTDWFGVDIAPKVEPDSEWRSAGDEVLVPTRRNIFDGLHIDSVPWWGSLDELAFLGRVFELEALPSFDSRFDNAAGDIWQHRVNNEDWDDDWVYSDERFNLLNCPTDLFLRFLCEIVHPVVRPDRNEALGLVQNFNDQLRKDGWTLVEIEKIAGRPRFVARRLDEGSRRSVTRARTVADALDASWMKKEIERLEDAIESDPSLAIGTAKELVESCCKTILSKRGVQISAKADLPELTKLVAKELKLVPEGISESARGAETIKLLLRNLSAQTHYLAELRGLYGSGHGRDGQYRGLQPRHARLAVGAAVSFIDFVSSTFHYQDNKE